MGGKVRRRNAHTVRGEQKFYTGRNRAFPP
jgi:hypothetical protein